MQFLSPIATFALLTPFITAQPTSSATVRVQLINVPQDLALQKEIPITGVATAFPGTFTDAFITDDNDNVGVTCQAYEDKLATIKLGPRFGLDQVQLNNGKEVTVAVVKCAKV